MGPVEILFITVTVIFAAIGVVRGYPRELGVTVMLLIALFVLTFFDSQFSAQIDALLTGLGLSAANVQLVRAMSAGLFLIIITFISYQGISLVFPGSKGNTFLSLMVGLINGYLFAGSMWYYQAEAGWPVLDVVPPYSALYDFLYQLLPPAILTWQYFIGLAVALLILRVVK